MNIKKLAERYGVMESIKTVKVRKKRDIPVEIKLLIKKRKIQEYYELLKRARKERYALGHTCRTCRYYNIDDWDDDGVPRCLNCESEYHYETIDEIPLCGCPHYEPYKGTPTIFGGFKFVVRPSKGLAIVPKRVVKSPTEKQINHWSTFARAASDCRGLKRPEFNECLKRRLKEYKSNQEVV